MIIHVFFDWLNSELRSAEKRNYEIGFIYVNCVLGKKVLQFFLYYKILICHYIKNPGIYSMLSFLHDAHALNININVDSSRVSNHV